MNPVKWALKTSANEVVTDDTNWKNGLAAPSKLEIRTSKNGVIQIELMEREPGYIQIRILDGLMVVEPEASNVISVRAKTYLEIEKESKQRGNRRKG